MNNYIEFINYLTKHKFFAAVYLLFILFIIIPIIYVLGGVLFFDASLISNTTVFNSEILLLLIKSSVIALCVALISTLLGTILGFILYKTDIKFNLLLKILFLIPLFISPYILAVAWKDFFMIFFSNANFLNSYYVVILVLTTVYTPLAMLITGSAFANIEATLEESGLAITNLKSVIFKIDLPLIKPALFSSFVLIFIFSISEFSVPAFWGINVFTTEIFTRFSAFYNHSLAVIQSLLLVLICIALLMAESKYISDAPFLALGSKGSNRKIYQLKKSKRKVLFFIIFTFLLFIVLPFSSLFIQAFKNGIVYFLRAIELLQPTIIGSVSLALLSALIITLVGFVSAYFANIESERKYKSFDWLLLIVFAVPSIVFGISLIKFYNTPALNFIYSGFVIIIIGYIGKFAFIASKIIGNSIKQIPKSLYEVAELEGISFFSIQKKIIFPLILHGLVASFIIVFIFSLGELAVTIMVYPPGMEIMPVKVFTIMANVPQALVSSMTLIVLLITFFMVLILLTITKLFIKKYGFHND